MRGGPRTSARLPVHAPTRMRRDRARPRRRVSRSEGPDEEGGHLLSEDGVAGAVEKGRGLAASGDGAVVEVLDEVGGEGAGGDIAEDACGRRRRVAGALGGLQQEDGHLGTGDGGGGAVVTAAAASGDALGGELLDPVGEGGGAGHVGEDSGARRWNV